MYWMNKKIVIFTNFTQTKYSIIEYSSELPTASTENTILENSLFYERRFENSLLHDLRMHYT